MKSAVIDIDGTIVDSSHRHKLITNKSTIDDLDAWDKFFTLIEHDQPVHNVIRLVEDLIDANYKIIFCTGRYRRYAIETMRQIEQFIDRKFEYELLMRNDDDYRHDHEVKKDMIPYLKNYDVRFVLEDRDSVVKMWRENGFTCFQVTNGDF